LPPKIFVKINLKVMRFIPWLYSPPSLAQALPGQFAESVANVRVLSWILLGALHARGGSNLCPIIIGNFQQQQMPSSASGQANVCLPVPIACSGQMADYIHFVLAGFADQSKVYYFNKIFLTLY
jgi:protein unc-79